MSPGVTRSDCVTCGAPLDPSTGPPRKFCSERCRKAQYAEPCVDCGRPHTGRASHPGQRYCVECGKRHAAEASTERARPQRELIERMWREGASSAAICAAIGSRVAAPSAYIANLRARGYDLPVRNPGSSLANIGNRSNRHSKAKAAA